MRQGDRRYGPCRPPAMSWRGGSNAASTWTTNAEIERQLYSVPYAPHIYLSERSVVEFATRWKRTYAQTPH